MIRKGGKMKKVTVKFTVAKGSISAIMYWLLHHKYTHAAIGLEKDSDVFYSFAYSGFSKENKRKRIPNSWRDNYAYYYIEVSDDVYLEMKKKIQNFEDNIESLKYSILEIITAFLNIPFKQKNKFFCSYFVADLLTSTGAYPLSKKSCTYMPHHLAKELENCEHIEYVSNTVSA